MPGGSTATANLILFYLTWSALVLGYATKVLRQLTNRKLTLSAHSHGQLSLELYGTLLIRLCLFLLPALGFLAFDVATPKLSKSVKARGERQLPTRHGRDKLVEITAVSVFNVLLGVMIQAVLEVLFTRVLHLKSLVKVTTVVPLPWSIVVDLLRGLVIRGSLHYAIHRYVLHAKPSILRTWHLSWQHSVETPFSLVAAYDHPVNHLLANWVPTILPAVLFRWHVLTWFLFLTIASLEELFVFSGYGVLPSAIILPGMARRTEAHFDSVKSGQQVGNFGHLGLIDFLLGTTCNSESTIVDDVQDEAEKRRFQERIDTAVQSALANMEDQSHEKLAGGKKEKSEQQLVDAGDDKYIDSGEADANDGSEGEEQADGKAPRRKGKGLLKRRKGAKG